MLFGKYEVDMLQKTHFPILKVVYNNFKMFYRELLDNNLNSQYIKNNFITSWPKFTNHLVP